MFFHSANIFLSQVWLENDQYSLKCRSSNFSCSILKICWIMMRSHINCVFCVRALFGIVFAFGTILAAITVHRLQIINKHLIFIFLVRKKRTFKISSKSEKEEFLSENALKYHATDKQLITLWNCQLCSDLATFLPSWLQINNVLKASVRQTISQ